MGGRRRLEARGQAYRSMLKVVRVIHACNTVISPRRRREEGRGGGGKREEEEEEEEEEESLRTTANLVQNHAPRRASSVPNYEQRVSSSRDACFHACFQDGRRRAGGT